MWRCMRRGVWKTFGEVQSAPPNAGRKQLLSELICVRWVVRCVEFCEMSCVSCEMSCGKELGWSDVREHESSSTKCHTKTALEWVELCEMTWVRWVVWDELCDLWDERSCVSCDMSGVVWDEFCELWDEWSCVRWVVWVVGWVVWVVRWVVWKNLGDVQCENTKAAPPNATRKQLLSELSCVRWVVRDELCQISCVTYEMRGVVWNELC